MMPSVADVEATTGLLLDLLDSADYCVRESGWGVKVFEDLSAAYRTDPGPIDAVFRKAQELGCFPCSADNWQLEDVRVRDVERAELAEKAFALMEWGPCRSILPQILDDAVSSLHTMSWEMIECFNRYEPPGFDMLFLDLLRKQPNPKCAGHRYLANDSIRHCVFAFKTAHEVAAWWIWHVGRYHDYSWNGPRSNDWWEWNVPEFIAQTRDNFEDAATRLIPILNLEYLKDLINDESLAMAAAIDGRSWPRRGTETINEWMTPPLVGMLTTAPLKLIDEGEYSWTVMDMSNNQEGVYPTGPSIDDVLEPPAVADTAIPSDGPDESTNEFRLDGEQFGPFTETEFDVLQEMWEHREGPWPQKDAHFHWHGKWRWPQTQDGSPFHKHQGSIKKKFEKQGFKLPWKLKLKAFYWHGLAPREDG